MECMAKKKSYQKINAYSFPDVQEVGQEIRITFRGQNSNRTEAKVTVLIDDYILVFLTRRAKEIAVSRIERAQSFHNKIKDAAL
jgi:hypothetical protein